MAIVVWWLVRPTLNVAPWMPRSPIEIARGDGALSMLPVQVGLGVFLAVATSLFALLISAYHMRMMEEDWTNLALPRVLWLNTVVLILASVAMQWTVVVARRGRMDDVRKRPGRGRRFQLCVSCRTGLGMATTECVGTFHCGQSGLRVLPVC